MLPPKEPTKRQIASKLQAAERKNRKIRAIGERRAKAAGMDKDQYIAEIVKGRFRPITAEDIADEPDPGVDAEPAPVA